LIYIFIVLGVGIGDGWFDGLANSGHFSEYIYAAGVSS